MNNAAQNLCPQKPPQDSLFGTLIVEACVGAAFGGAAAALWKGAEMADTIWMDRRRASNDPQPQARTNGTFELGVKKSLGPVFAATFQSVAEQERESFAAFMKPAASAFSARSFG